MDQNNIYVSLDEARSELKKRWNNVELKKKIEDELGENFCPEYKDIKNKFNKLSNVVNCFFV